MINIKTPREIVLMRKAGQVVALVLEKLHEVIKPGISLLEIDKIAEEIIFQNDCTPSFKGYEGFPNAVCASVNDVLVHGIPNNYRLKDGDIVTIDVGACYKGYHGDGAYTYKVGNVSKEVCKLLEVTEKALYLGLEQIKPLKRVGDISNAIQTYVEEHGYSLPSEYTGHGVGNDIHEEPNVPNVGKPNTMAFLKKGMVIAVEPMVFMGKKTCVVDKDGWTVRSKDHSWAAHYEHTVVVTEDGCEILTKL